jgi:hypothetical protein
MTDPFVRQAFREKLAICVIVAIWTCVVGMVTLGSAGIICDGIVGFPLVFLIFNDDYRKESLECWGALSLMDEYIL